MNVGLALMPPSTRSVVDRQPGVGLGRLDEVGAAVGDALQHGPHDVGRSSCPGSRRAACRGRRSPSAACPGRAGPARTRRRRSSSHGGGDVVALGAVAMQPEVVAQPLDVGAGRQHDRLDAPRQPRRRATRRRSGTCRARRAGPTPGASAPRHTSSMPPVPNVILARPGAHAALADQRALLVADEGGDRRAPGQRRAPRRRRRSCRRRSGSTPAGMPSGREHVRRSTPMPSAAQQAGDGGVGVVGDVDRAAGQRPRQPGVDGAEAQVAVARRRRRGRAATPASWPTGSAPARGRARPWPRCTRRPCAGPASRAPARSARRSPGPTRSWWPAGW